MTKTQHERTANSSVERDLWPVSKGHVIVRFFSKAFGSHNFPCWSLLLGTNVPNDIHYDNNNKSQLFNMHNCYICYSDFSRK